MPGLLAATKQDRRSVQQVGGNQASIQRDFLTVDTDRPLLEELPSLALASRKRRLSEQFHQIQTLAIERTTEK